MEAHKRIIWACSWSPCDRFFATASRDKSVKIWTVDDDVGGGCVAKQSGVLPMFRSSVTAVAWAPCTTGDSYLLAIGMEDGLLEIWKGKPVWGKSEDERKAAHAVAFESTCLFRLDKHLCHVASVNRLAWSSWRGLCEAGVDNSSTSEHMQLASCGADHAVRVFSLKWR